MAAILFTTVIFGVLGVIAYSGYQSGLNRQQVYMLRHDVLAGQVISQGDLVSSMVRADPDEFRTAESRALGSLIGHHRYLITLHRDDILRQDDTEDADRAVQVPVNIAIGAAGVAVGDTIDIYADSNGSTLLVGRHLPVLALGSPLLIGVDAQTSAYWVSLSFSTTRLAAVRSTSRSSAAEAVEVTTAQALCVLAGSTTCPPPLAPPR
ncbi:MAG: hypothetical protein NVS3B18_06090 [Candidatus Dormibacteria bacterium]